MLSRIKSWLLSLGRPVITGDSKAAKEVFQDGENIFLVPLDDPEALADKILWVRANYGQSLEVAARGHQVFKDQFFPEKVTDLVGEILRELCPNEAQEKDL